MVGVGNVLLGYVAHEVLFHLQRGGGLLGHQSQPVGHAEHMRVDCHRGMSEPYGLNHIGGLLAHARQLHQLVVALGHLARMVGYQCPCHGHQVARLGVGVAHRPYILQHIVGLGLRHTARVGIMAEKVGRHLVNALVGTLGRQHRGDEQLKCRSKQQLGRHMGLRHPKGVEYALVAFFSCHLIMSTERFRNLSSASPFSMPFCSNAKSMSWCTMLLPLA